jgi:hypothetical protein
MRSCSSLFSFWNLKYGLFTEPDVEQRRATRWENIYVEKMDFRISIENWSMWNERRMASR